MKKTWLMLLAGMTWSTIASAQPTAGEVMAALQKNDATLTASFTITVRIQRPSHPFDPAQGLEIESGVMTTDGRWRALLTRSTFEHPPIFQSEGTADYRAFDYSGGALVVWRTSEVYGLSAPDRNDTLELLERSTVAPDGSLVERVAHAQLQRHPGGSPDNLPEWEQVLLALGRGYAANLRSITSVVPQPGGLVKIQAQGTWGTIQGAWALIADPRAGYLVRDGRFVADGDLAPRILGTSSGVVAVTGALSLAGSGKLRHVRSSGPAYELAVELDKYQRPADSVTLAEVRRRVTAPLVPGDEILDLRTSPPTRTFVR